MTTALSLEQIYRLYQRDARLLALKPEGANFVVGEGKVPSEIMFVGEAPGANEDKSGRPFMGNAGEVFNALLLGIGRKREDVFVTNIFKYRPPNNTKPVPAQVVASMPYLRAEIKVVDPQVIVLMGRVAAQAFFPMMSKFEDKRGRLTTIKDRIFIVTYHPAASFHDAAILGKLQGDFKKIKAALHGDVEQLRGYMD